MGPLKPKANARWSSRWFRLREPPGRMVWASVGMVTLLLITGAVYFRRTERTLADVV